MNYEQKLWETVSARNALEAEAMKKSRMEASNKRLGRILKKKLTTSFIGAIANIEKFFGHVWGHGKPASECTQEQLDMREMWDKLRTSILNNGNNQLRAVESELEQYDIVWNMHRENFVAKPIDNQVVS
jgi:hypothetical protein